MNLTKRSESKEAKLSPTRIFNGRVPLMIPAYSNEKKGYVVSADVLFAQHSNLKITPVGNIAQVLYKALQRTLAIFSRINVHYETLCHMHYCLVCHADGYQIEDVRSAGLPLSIAVLQILSKQQNKTGKTNLIGSGVLRIDGSLGNANQTEVKQKAVANNYPGFEFIHVQQFPHIFDLETYILGEADSPNSAGTSQPTTKRIYENF